MTSSVAATAVAPRLRAARQAGLPPGPRMPALLQTLRGLREGPALIEACARRYGDAFTVRLVGMPPMVIMSRPSAIEEIFTAEADALHAGETTELLAPFVGPSSVMLSDGARHMSLRRILQPAFHGERMHDYAAVIRDVADGVFDAWRPGERLRMQEQFQAITLDIILRAVFGVAESEVLAEMRRRMLRFLGAADRPSAALLLIPSLQRDLGRYSPWGRFLRDRGAVDEMLFAEIARRRTEGTAGRKDVLSQLVEVRDERGAPLGDELLRDQMLTLVMAGHETTTTALAWATWHLWTHPDVLSRARAEIASVIGGGAVEPGHVGRLEYLDAVIKESARLAPVLELVARRLTKPMRVGGWDLPAGCAVAPCNYLTHRLPDVWSDATRFDPSRFLAAKPSPYEYFPFGGGVRRCLGAAFATYEMKLVLAQLLARVDLELAPGYQARVERRVRTLAPSQGMPVVVQGVRARPS